jgi:hypothetical protein
MAHPVTERRRDRLMTANGWRLLLLGGILFAIGLVVMLAADGLAAGIGVAFASLATVPTIAGGGLVVSSAVGRRAGQGKPFA